MEMVLNMGYDNFKTYFNKNIKQYAPYSNNLFFQSFITFLLDPFLKDSYSLIPSKLIDLFESQTISSETYDSILESLGYPNSFISSISVFHKKIILTKFSNYYKYKATITHFEEICKTFSEPVNLYELYIIKKQNNYFFMPKKIYESVDLTIEPLDYVDTYNKLPNYFISKDVIANQSCAFPIKTNVLYFTLSKTLDFSDIKNLIVSIVLYYFKESNITISLFDESYIFTLNSISQLWFYILNLYSSNNQLQPVITTITIYDIDNPDCKYSLSDPITAELITAYEDIQNTIEVFEFINKYIKPIFSTYPIMQITTISELRTLLSYSIDIKIIEKIENDIATSTNSKQEIYTILSDILASINVWILNNPEDLLKKYSSYIIEAFNLPFSTPENSIIYKLINFFKPFHTEIYTMDMKNIIYKSKTDTVIPNDSSKINTTDNTSNYYSAYIISDSFTII